MKISGRKDSPHNPRLFFTVTPIVLLGGRVVERVIEADEEAGFIIVEEQDENGRPVLRDDQIVEKMMLGKVQIVVPAIHALRPGLRKLQATPASPAAR